ncbi:MAG: two-component regulator propeller domain-containing protein [Thermodesulfobacteriota bacterium]
MKHLSMRSFFILITPIFFLSTPVNAEPMKKPLSFQSFTVKDGLSSDMVNAVAVQRDQVWFGTEGGGATLFDPGKNLWRAYTTKGEPPDKIDRGKSIEWQNILSHNHVSVIVPDGDRTWFGTYFYGFGGGGISYYQPSKKPPWKRFNTNNGNAKKVVSIAVDGDTVWVGSEKGLSFLDKKTDTWKGFYSPEDGLSGNFINALLVQAGDLWIGTNAGMTRSVKGKKRWRKYGTNEGVPETEIKALASVGQKIWAGSADGILFEYDPSSDRWKSLESTDSLKGGGIYGLAVARERVWVCRDNGVSVYDMTTGQWEAITPSQGLPSGMVFSAAGDKNGIWFGTDKGASKLVLSP